VCSAAMVDRIAVAAPSTLSAAPSMISSPNSPASAGASFWASSAASRFTLASSEPTIARMLAVDVLVLASGIRAYFIANARWFSKRYHRILRAEGGSSSPCSMSKSGSETAFILASPDGAAHPSLWQSFLRLLQARPEILGRIFAELFFERRDGRKLGGIKTREPCFERRMPPQCIEQCQEAWFIGCDQKPPQPLRFIIKSFDIVGRWPCQ